MKAPQVELIENEIIIDSTQATVFAKISDDGGGTIKSKGFVFGLVGARQDSVFCSGERFSTAPCFCPQLAIALGQSCLASGRVANIGRLTIPTITMPIT